MTDRSADGEPDEEQAGGAEPPRLQSTGEREAIPLPLPDGEAGDAPDDPTGSQTAAPGEGDEAGTQPGPMVPAPAPDEISPPIAPEATPVAEGDDVPGPAAPGPELEAAAAAAASSFEPTAGDAPTYEPTAAPPPYAPAGGVSDLTADEPGPRPEMLVGAAFAGGIVMALVLRRVLR